MTSKETSAKIADLKKLIEEGNKALALIGAAGSEQERARARQIRAILNEASGTINIIEEMLEFQEEMDAEIIFEDKSKEESHQPESSSGNV